MTRPVLGAGACLHAEFIGLYAEEHRVFARLLGFWYGLQLVPAITYSSPVSRLPSPSPAYHRDLNALRRSHTLPIVASPSTRERNYIGADMILAKELQGLVRWRIAFMNESVQALLPCCHSRYGAPS
jgi:hypothetical protein